MFRLVVRSMRAKSVLAGLIPLLLVLAAVGFIGVRAYDRIARDMVTQRDAELARVTGERLAERLGQEARLLQELAADERVRSLDGDGVRSALEEAAALGPFNGGIVVYSASRITVGASPSSAERAVTASGGESLRLLTAVRATLRPAFSDIFRDSVSGEDAILIGVPIRSTAEEFGGMLAGVVTLRTSLLGAVFAEVLELRGGRTGFAYLVDGHGRVIYHRDLFRVGTDLSGLPPVEQVLAGRTEALISDDPAGTEVVAGFAPVPGTGWGVVTQEHWSLISGPIRDSGLLLLAMLGGGALLSATLVFVAIGRTLRPIRNFARGADRIAAGDFDHRIETDTDRELRGLAEQFNAMAGALRDSYADLEHRVEVRTEENRQLYVEAEQRAAQLSELNARAVAVADVAARVSSILDIDELLTYVTGLLHETFGYHTVYVFLFEPETGALVARAGASAQKHMPPAGYRIEPGEGINGWVAESGEPALVNDVTSDPRRKFVPELEETRSQLSVPITSGDEVLGVIGIEHITVNAFDETDLFTARTLADQLAVALDNARSKESIDVLNEIMRIAVSSLDIAQTFDAVREQVWELIDDDRLSIDLRPSDDEDSELMAFAAAGHGYLELEAVIPVESPQGEVIRTGRAVLRTHFPEDSVYPVEFEFAGRHTLRSFMFVPLRSKGAVIGSLNFASLRPGRYAGKELQIAQQIADHLAVIVEHTLLEEESRDVAVLAERNRMAREIHDTLAQGFTGIVLQLEAAEQAHEQAAGAHDHGAVQAELTEHLGRAKDLARDSLNEARRSVWDLAPRALDAQPLAGAIEREVRRFADGGSERASFSLSGEPPTLPPPIETALLRICQESLANVRRHAHASEVSVELEFTASAIRLRIGDDGEGFQIVQCAANRPRARRRVRDLRHAAARATAQRVADGAPYRRQRHARGGSHPDNGGCAGGALRSPRAATPRRAGWTRST